jgi:hypothetical protein
MAGPVQEYLIREFGTVGSLQDSTHLGQSRLSSTRNVVMRPLGAVKGIPVYQRLWAIGATTDIYTTLAALTLGGNALVPATDGTIAVQIARQGKNWLLFYNLLAQKARGLFYMGDDGTFDGTPSFTTGAPTYTVLAKGLHATARWYGSTYYGALYLGNGQDDNVIVQLGRSATPGVWRKAASNSKPTAAVLRQVPPATSAAVQASWTIPGGACSFTRVPAVACTASASTDRFTAAAHGLPNGRPVRFVAGSGGTLPNGVTAGTTYYVRDAQVDTFKVAATVGGSAINLTTNSVAPITVQDCVTFLSTSHPLAENATCQLTTTDTLPAGLSLATDYYPVGVTADTFQLAASSGGTPIVVTDAGVGTHTATNTAPGRTGNASLTFRANATNFPGTAGENIYVSIVYQAGGSVSSGAISSAMTGKGTVSDPYYYTIYTDNGYSSNNAIVAFVNADTKALGILSASTSSSNAVNDAQSWAMTGLDGGVDGGTSGGFSNKTCSVYLRYWDPGLNNLGYEGISSDKSNVLIIDATSNFDVEVAVQPDAVAQAERFGYIRVYMQYGEEPTATWNLVGEVANSTSELSFIAAPEVTCTVTHASDTVNKTAHGLSNGTAVRISSTGTVPGGLSASTTYYVRDASANSFKLATTVSGAVVNITNAGSGTIKYRLAQRLYVPGHNYNVNDVLRIQTVSTLPTPVAAGVDYYVVASETDYIGLSTSLGGSAITFTTLGSSGSTIGQQQIKLVIGTSTEVGQEMWVDQHRPLPSVHHVFAGGSVWHGGVTGNQERLYPSKTAVDDELLPEGANNDAYERIISGESPGNSRVTALYSDDYRLHVHTRNSVLLLDPTNPDTRHSPQVLAGALNATALAVWTGSMIYYLGADLQLYTIAGTRYGKRDSEFVALDAAAYIRDLVARQSYIDAPERCFMFPDVAGQMLWYWLPSDSGLIGFAYDFLQKGTIGPFDFPKVYAMCRMEAERPEYVFCDEAGNLFVWDTTAQYDHGDAFPASPAPTLRTAGTGATTNSEDGYGVVAVTGGEYWKAVTSHIETGLIDLGKPSVMKQWLGLTITSVAGSRGQLAITVTGKNGNVISRTYGDIAVKGTQNTHKVLFMAQDTAVKVKVSVIGAEQVPWCIRDVTLSYRVQNQF